MTDLSRGRHFILHSYIVRSSFFISGPRYTALLPPQNSLSPVNSSRSSKPEAERTCGEMVEKLPYEKGEAAKEVRPGFFDSGAVSAPGVFP